MDDDLARHVARTALRIARELQETAAFMKQHLDLDEHRTYARDIAAATDAVMTNLIDRPLATRPQLRAEIEESIRRYGRYL